VFWSQSLIAEVYTLNVCFFLVLALLGLRACPPSPAGAERPGDARLLAWMALAFGLSLSNHWPLMLLVAPAFAVLLWPMRLELLKRLGVLSWLVVLGLVPYAWLIRRSWMALPISFDGPLETLPEILFFLSRAGYAEVDDSPTANWLDRLRFFRFLGGQLLIQFAVVGTLLSAAGFAVQWRLLGRRVALFLTVAFLMPTVVLLLLLNFDYDSVSKHVFHVYPLPAYAVAALWMGLGLVWLVNRVRARPAHGAAAAAAVLAIIAAVGIRSNLLANADWAARYARAVLDTLPKDAILFVHGDGDLPPIAYLHMIENVRPDITLYHTRGLILGNRLFHPLRNSDEQMNANVNEFVRRQTAPVAFTENFGFRIKRERWLHMEVGQGDAAVEIAPAAERFLEDSVLNETHDRNAWVAHFQGELRRRYAVLLARSLPRTQAHDERSRRQLAALSASYQGALGLAEGLMGNDGGYSAGAVSDMLARAQALMPADVRKAYRSKYFYLRGALRLDLGDRQGAAGDFETALTLWPSATNQATKPLEDLYRQAGDEKALKALQERVKRRKR
jgi:tetratricopeptide (TPR) repeat protein